MEFSELFIFASFGKVRLLKFGNFSEKNGIFELTLNSNFGNREKLVPTEKPTRKLG